MATSTASPFVPPPRTPSPKVRIVRSQSFDSPSSIRTASTISPTPSTPASKSMPAISKTKPRINVLEAAEHGMGMITHVGDTIVLHNRLSNESMASSTESSPISPTSAEEERFGLFSQTPLPMPSQLALSLPEAPSPPPFSIPELSQSSNTGVAPPSPFLYQEVDSPTGAITPAWDPLLVRIVLDLYDTRGFDWTQIAEPVNRMWGLRTGSAEVLGILQGNGRIRYT